MHNLGLQGDDGLQPSVLLLFSLAALSGVKRFSERLGSLTFSTGLLKLKLMLQGTCFGKFLDRHGKAVLLF